MIKSINQNYFASIVLVISVALLLSNIVLPVSINIPVVEKIYYHSIRNFSLAYLFCFLLYFIFYKKDIFFQYISATNRKFACAFFVFGLSLLITSKLGLRSISEGGGPLQAYIDTGKMFLYSSVIMLAIQKEIKFDLRISLLWLGLLIFSLSFLNCYLAVFFDHADRVRFGWTNIPATGLAYQYCILYFFFLGCSLSIVKNNKLSIFLIGTISILCFATIFLTGTRSAMLALPVGIVLLLLLAGKLTNLKIILAFCTLFLCITAISYPALIKPRIDELKKEQQTQFKDGSFSFRLDMWHASLETAKKSPWFGGKAIRTQVIEEGIANGSYAPILKEYDNVSMHNDLLDTLSLRGLVGVFFLLGFYFSLFCIAGKSHNLPLAGVLFGTIFFGLVDGIIKDFGLVNLICLLFMIGILTIPPKKPVLIEKQAQVPAGSLEN